MIRKQLILNGWQVVDAVDEDDNRAFMWNEHIFIILQCRCNNHYIILHTCDFQHHFFLCVALFHSRPSSLFQTMWFLKLECWAAAVGCTEHKPNRLLCSKITKYHQYMCPLECQRWCNCSCVKPKNQFKRLLGAQWADISITIYFFHVYERIFKVREANSRNEKCVCSTNKSLD